MKKYQTVKNQEPKWKLINFLKFKIFYFIVFIEKNFIYLNGYFELCRKI